jgi:hypothetical protein
MCGPVTVNLKGFFVSTAARLQASGRSSDPLPSGPSTTPGGRRAEARRLGVAVGDALLEAHAETHAVHRPHEVLDHAVGFGVVDVEAVELAVAHHVARRPPPGWRSPRAWRRSAPASDGAATSHSGHRVRAYDGGLECAASSAPPFGLSGAGNPGVSNRLVTYAIMRAAPESVLRCIRPGCAICPLHPCGGATCRARGRLSGPLIGFNRSVTLAHVPGASWRVFSPTGDTPVTCRRHACRRGRTTRHDPHHQRCEVGRRDYPLVGRVQVLQVGSAADPHRPPHRRGRPAWLRAGACRSRPGPTKPSRASRATLRQLPGAGGARRRTPPTWPTSTRAWSGCIRPSFSVGPAASPRRPSTSPAMTCGAEQAGKPVSELLGGAPHALGSGFPGPSTPRDWTRPSACSKPRTRPRLRQLQHQARLPAGAGLA